MDRQKAALSLGGILIAGSGLMAGFQHVYSADASTPPAVTTTATPSASPTSTPTTPVTSPTASDTISAVPTASSTPVWSPASPSKGSQHNDPNMPIPNVSSSANNVSVNINVHQGQIKTIGHVPAGSTVGDALEAAHVYVDPNDQVVPSVNTIVKPGMNVNVNNNYTKTWTEDLVIDQPDTIYVDDSSLVKGNSKVIQAGSTGIKTVTFRAQVVDGRAMNIQTVKTVVTKPAVAQKIAVGTASPTHRDRVITTKTTKTTTEVYPSDSPSPDDSPSR